MNQVDRLSTDVHIIGNETAAALPMLVSAEAATSNITTYNSSKLAPTLGAMLNLAWHNH